MFQNKIHNSNISCVEKMLQESKIKKNLHLVEIQGKEIQSWKEYISKIENTFKLPREWVNTIDGYNDWMRDLEWLEKDEYMLIIYDYKSFLEQDPLLKKIIMDGFDNLILPWWQEEVERCAVDGKAKRFNVYLID